MFFALLLCFGEVGGGGGGGQVNGPLLIRQKEQQDKVEKQESR